MRRLPSTTQLVQKYTQYGQTVRQRYDANNLLPRQFVMKESRNQKGCHWGYKQDEEEIEKCGLGSICREYKSDRTSCISHDAVGVAAWVNADRRRVTSDDWESVARPACLFCALSPARLGPRDANGEARAVYRHGNLPARFCQAVSEDQPVFCRPAATPDTVHRISRCSSPSVRA